MRKLILLLILVLGATTTQAQTDLFDTLPPCNFTAAAPDPNIEVGAVVFNIETGRGCAENLDEMFPVASVPKVFVAAALYDWILTSDVIGFDTALTFTDRYWMGGRGDCLAGSDLNRQVTFGELSDIMIACSDNAATWMLMDAMGWQTVDDYVARQGINGLGRVIPYAEVDRQKLIFLDERWASVPTAMASRFYRSEMTTGLDAYFPDGLPTYTWPEEIEANASYFNETDFNSATPRAMAQYLLRMAQAAPQRDDEGQVARWLFNAMLLTQRQFTAQAIPGTVSVGAKNGWDTGLRAEINVMFDNLPENQRNPEAFSVIFARQKDLTVPNLQPPNTSDAGVINQYLLQLAPVISNFLYPGYIDPDVAFSRQLSSVVVNPKVIMDSCWNPYADRGFLFEYRGQLENCWLSLPQSRIAPGDSIGVGLVLQNLGERDTRLTIIYTQPDGTRRSYQTERFFQNSAAVYWFHPIARDRQLEGEWQVDVYLNRVRIVSQTVEVRDLLS